jgi:uncharacterized protein (TIGR00266 family)
MSWMSPNMQMDTNSGGGARKVFGRLLSGESLFLNEYAPQGGRGVIAFASRFPGSIIPYEVRPGQGIIVQKRGWLAMEKGLDVSIHFQKKLSRGLFGGEGFIMQRISGDGLVFLEIDGHCKEYELQAGQSIVVDTGCLAAMSESCTMDIQMIKGAKNIFLGGEGLFLTVISGPGKVWLQSMPLSNVAQALTPYLPTASSGDGINIKLGGE